MLPILFLDCFAGLQEWNSGFFYNSDFTWNAVHSNTSLSWKHLLDYMVWKCLYLRRECHRQRILQKVKLVCTETRIGKWDNLQMIPAQRPNIWWDLLQHYYFSLWLQCQLPLCVFLDNWIFCNMENSRLQNWLCWIDHLCLSFSHSGFKLMFGGFRVIIIYSKGHEYKKSVKSRAFWS